MKKYNITVNGITYEVLVEEAGGSAAAPVATAPVQVAAPAPVAAAPVPTPAPAPPAPVPAPVAAPTPSAGAQKINAPMPGTILDIKVAPGQPVNQGDTLLVLEAMKMENEIYAPAAGTVDVVCVTKGVAVNSGDLLLTLK